MASLDCVDEDILVAELIDLGLDDGVIGIRDLRRAVRHDEDGVVLALLRELRRERLMVSVTSSGWFSWPCQYISEVPSVIFLNWFL